MIYRWIAAGAGLLVAGFLIWYFQAIVFYILISAVLSLMGKPLVRWLGMVKIHKWSPPKWLSAMVTLILMMLLIGLAAQAIIPVVVSKANQLASFDPQSLTSALNGPIAQVESYIREMFPRANFSVKDYIVSQVMPLLSSGMIQDTITSVTGFIVDIGIAVFSISFITFFFLKDDSLFFDGVIILFPARYEENIKRALNSTTTLLIRYFVGICIEMIIKLICIAVPLYFIGFEWSTAFIIGLIAAVLNVVPYIGPIIGALIGFAIAIISPVEGANIGVVLLQMSIVFGIFQLIDNIILQPYIYSSSVKAHPLEIFIVILMAGYIAGVMGMLFAIPAYTVLRVFAKEFFNNFRVVQKLTENI